MDVKNKEKVSLSRTTVVSLLCIAFVCGAFCGYAYPSFLIIVLLLLGVNILTAVIWKHWDVARLCLLLSVLFLLGFLRMSLSIPPPVSPERIDYYNGRQGIVHGIVCDVPYMQGNNVVLTLCSERMQIDNTVFPLRGGIHVTLPLYAQVDYGDVLLLEGKLETPKDFGDFSYRNYLLKDNIFSVMNGPRVVLEGKNRGHPLYSVMYGLRSFLDEKIGVLFPGMDGALLSGLILGGRKSLSSDILNNLQRTGLTHIIALSGFNITIIISFLAGFVLKRCRRGIRFVLSALFVVLFTILVGSTPSVVRASCMGLLGLFALFVGRRAEGLSLLLCTLVLLILLHPLSLVLDIGFQLSFMATLGLILLSPVLQRLFSRLPSFFSLKEVLITTLSAQIMVVPYLLSYFGQLSLISPLTNVLVLSVIPITMLIGSLAVAFSLIPPLFFVAKVVGFVAWMFLRYIIGVIDLFSTVPFASIAIPFWGTATTLLYYLALTYILVVYHKKSHALQEPSKYEP